MIRMRNATILLVGLAIVGCDAKESATEPEDSSTPAAVVESSRTAPPTEDQIKTILEAVSQGDVDAMKVAFGDDIDPNFTFADGKTVLSAAASLGNLEVATFMLEIGADPAKGDQRGMTPLHYAALYSRGDSVIPILIEAGVSVNVREASGLTPLHCAATGDSEATVALLLDRGADKTLKDGFGATPEKTANLNDKVAIARIIQSHTK